MEFARLPWCVQIFVLVCSCLMMDVHACYSLGPKEILSNNTYILYTYIYIYNALGFNAHIYSFKVKIYVIYHNISSNHWGKSYLTAEKKKQRGQAVTKFKPTKQGQTYTLKTSTYLILQTNPLPLQISNGENMKFLWVTKLKMIENQKGLALQRWIRLFFFYIFSHQAQKHPSTKLGFIYVEK